MAPAIIPYEVRAENGLFQPILTLVQKSTKLTPRLGHTRAGAKQRTLYPSSTNSLAVLCNLAPPASLVSWRQGSPLGVKMLKLAKAAISGGRPGLAFVAILSGPALNHGP